MTCLPAVRGAWKHPGAGLYGSIGQNFRLDTSLITGVESQDVRRLDMSQLGPILTAEAGPLQGGPEVTAMLVQSSTSGGRTGVWQGARRHDAERLVYLRARAIFH